MKYAAIITYTTGERTGATVSANGLEAAWETGNLNPEWTEWLMGFPTGWTELDASETRCARPSSSPSSNKSD